MPENRSPTEAVAAALAAIRAGDADTLERLLDVEPGLLGVEVGAGGSLLGEVAQPDVFGSSLGHALAVDRACVIHEGAGVVKGAIGRF